MNKIAQWASLALACVGMSVGSAAVSAPVAAQQTLAAATSEPELRRECLRWFGGKSYSGQIKNASYYYRFGRTVTVTFNTDGHVVQQDGKLVCEVRARSEGDDRRVWDETYYFDGTTALFTDPKKPTTDWTSFRPSGRCLSRDGRFRSNFGFGDPDEPGHIYKAGGGSFCP